MWTTLALAAALGTAAGQADQLTVTNVRATYGELGPLRQDNKVLPGDRYDVAFDVDGIKVGEDGKVLYSMGMEVVNSQGKVVYGREPRNQEAIFFLGGSRMTVTTYLTPGFAYPAGTYTLRVTVTDRATKATTTMTHKYELLAKDFGLVIPALSFDPDSRFPSPPRGVTGQQLYFSAMVVGFDRDKGKGQQPDISLEMRILDENGKATLAKSVSEEINKDVGQEYVLLPMNFRLLLNRPGKFTIEVTGTDRLSKKKAKLSYPITVEEVKAPASTEQK